MSYDRPWRFLRWSGYRRTTRAFTLRTLPIRQLLLVEETLDALRTKMGHDFDYPAACSALVGLDALLLPREALYAIWNAHTSLNGLPSEEGTGGTQVALDVVIRRMEREPFNLKRPETMDLTVKQIIKRLEEWGEERQQQLEAEAAIRAQAGE